MPINWKAPLYDIRSDYLGQRALLIATINDLKKQLYTRVVYFFADRHVEVLTDKGQSNVTADPIVSNVIIDWERAIISVLNNEPVKFRGILKDENIFNHIIEYKNGDISVVTENGCKYPGYRPIIKNATQLTFFSKLKSYFRSI